MASKECPECGISLPPDALFCSSCGARVDRVDAEDEGTSGTGGSEAPDTATGDASPRGSASDRGTGVGPASDPDADSTRERISDGESARQSETKEQPTAEFGDEDDGPPLPYGAGGEDDQFSRNETPHDGDGNREPEGTDEFRYGDQDPGASPGGDEYGADDDPREGTSVADRYDSDQGDYGIGDGQESTGTNYRYGARESASGTRPGSATDGQGQYDGDRSGGQGAGEGPRSDSRPTPGGQPGRGSAGGQPESRPGETSEGRPTGGGQGGRATTRGGEVSDGRPATGRQGHPAGNAGGQYASRAGEEGSNETMLVATGLLTVLFYVFLVAIIEVPSMAVLALLCWIGSLGTMYLDMSDPSVAPRNNTRQEWLLAAGFMFPVMAPLYVLSRVSEE